VRVKSDLRLGTESSFVETPTVDGNERTRAPIRLVRVSCLLSWWDRQVWFRGGSGSFTAARRNFPNNNTLRRGKEEFISFAFLFHGDYRVAGIIRG
jgi:hypothetical protein